jgi:hypothetical protein
MKTLARAVFLMFVLGCGGDDDSCTPGSGEPGAPCSEDADCASCECGPPIDGARRCTQLS